MILQGGLLKIDCITNHNLVVITDSAWRTSLLQFWESNIDFIVIGILLFAFWLIRKHELDRMNKKFTTELKKAKPVISQENEHPDALSEPEKLVNEINCPTRLFKVRHCFFLNPNDGHPPDDGFKNRHEWIDLKNLHSKVNTSVFCEHVCPGISNNGYNQAKSVPVIFFNQKTCRLESLWDTYLNVPEPVKMAVVETMPEKKVHGSRNGNMYDFPQYQFSSFEDFFIRKAFSIIEQNYGDFRFAPEILAGGLNMSLSQVNRRLNQLTGYPAGHLIRLYRLGTAAELLIRKAGTISEICIRSGFNEPGYFSRVFKKQFGCSPSVYQKILIEKHQFLRQ